MVLHLIKSSECAREFSRPVALGPRARYLRSAPAGVHRWRRGRDDRHLRHRDDELASAIEIGLMLLDDRLGISPREDQNARRLALVDEFRPKHWDKMPGLCQML